MDTRRYRDIRTHLFIRALLVQIGPEKKLNKLKKLMENGHGTVLQTYNTEKKKLITGEKRKCHSH